jgi:hypothetical protein
VARHRAHGRHRIAIAVAAALVLLVTGVAFYVLRSSEQQARTGTPPAWMTEAQKGTFDKPRATGNTLPSAELMCTIIGPCYVPRPLPNTYECVVLPFDECLPLTEN